MNIKISTTNSKLGYQIPSVSLPPHLSCRNDAPCKKYVMEIKEILNINKS